LFCGNKCRGEWISKNKSGKNSPSYSRVTKKCVYCNKVIQVVRYRQNKLNFCNKLCCRKYFVGPNATSYIHGMNRIPYPREFQKNKEIIRKRDNNKCQLCDVPQLEFIKKFPVHHIDYDKFNSDTINLIVLCNNCHRRVHKNKSYWKAILNKYQIDRNAHELIKENV
jgi:hypothetical protein